MKEQRDLKRFVPYITAFLVFLAVTAVCFAPQFEGRTLHMSDVTQYEGAVKDIKDHVQTYGEDPQWAGSTFSGMPSVLLSMQQKSMVLKYLFPLFDFLGRPASLVFVAMAAFFVMLLMFRVDPWVAIAPALAYGLSTYFFLIIGAGHITKMVALAYTPLMLGSVHYALKRNIWLGGALTALFASLQIAANHPQITYYFGFVLLAMWVNEGITAWKEQGMPRFARATAVLLVAGLFALGSNFAPLWYTSEYSKESIRGGSELAGAQGGTETRGSGLDLEYATQWSYGKTESFNMLIPNLYGGESSGGFSGDGKVASALARYNARGMAVHLPGYWGPQPFTGGPTYIGAVVIFLCVMGLFLLRGRNKWWLIAVSVLALMLAWGRNFMWLTELFFNYFPGYNKFRTVSTFLVVLQWSVPLLAALAVNKIWSSGTERKRVVDAIKYAAAITGGIALFFLLLGGSVLDFTSANDGRMGLPQDIISAMRSKRASMMRSDSLRSLIFVLFTAGTVWVFALEKLRKGYFAAILGLLVLADMVPVNMRFLPWSDYVETRVTEITATPEDLEIMKDTTPGYRVLNLTVDPFQDATTSYFHRSVGGYHGAKMQRYQDIIDHHLGKMNWQVYNMLNTKYIIVGDPQTGERSVSLNPDANGAAWFVEDVVVVEDASAEIAALDRIDTKNTAVIDRRFADMELPAGRDSLSRIELVDYRANRLIYEYYTPHDAVAVFSEIYYEKGWEAFVDGEPTPHFRADYVLRGMVLPAGEHTVEFRFRAANYRAVSAMTLTFSLLIILSVAGASVYTIIRNRRNNTANGKGRQEDKA